MIHFDPGTSEQPKHIYTRDDGTVLPSVTQILKGAGLIDDRWYTEDSARLGTAVHAACAYDARGTLDPDSIHPRVRPYFAAWRMFRDRLQPRFELVEYIVDGGHFSGTLDLTLRFHGEAGGGPWLVDIKTGQPQPWHAIQLAAYMSTFPHPLTLRRAVLYLHDDERYTWQYCKTGKYLYELSIFSAAFVIHQWKGQQR